MPKRIINIITYVLTLGFGIFLIWLSLKDLKQEEIEKIKYALGKANYILIIPGLLLGYISHWSRAIRWRYLMEPMGYRPGLPNTILAVLIGYIANLAFPRLGEVLKCTILAKYEKVPADKLVGTIIAERAFDMLCLLIIFVITFVIQIDLASHYLKTLLGKFTSNQHSSSGNGLYWTLGVVLLVLVAVFMLRKTIMNIQFVVKLKDVFRNVMKGILSFKDMKNKTGFVLHTIIIWTMYLGLILLGFQCFSETSHLTIKPAFSILSFGSIGMIVTPGGLGAYTLLVEEIVGLYGIDKAIGVALSWIIWLVPTFIVLLGGIISFILLPLHNNKKQHAEQTRNNSE